METLNFLLFAIFGFSIMTVVSSLDTQRLVIIDTDGGVDDGVSLLMVLGEPKLNVKAITCVAGTAQLEDCLLNVLKVLKVTGKLNKVDVYAGSPYALVRYVEKSTYFGTDGFLNIEFPNPPPRNLVKSGHAAVFLADFVKQNPGKVTVLELGPLSNIALAIHLNENFLQELKELIVMGGSYLGECDVKPGAEFNFYTDPEAASFVFNRSSVLRVEITMFPLETIMKNIINTTWRWTLLRRKSPSIILANKLELMAYSIFPPYFAWDTYAACYLIDRSFVTATEENTILVEYGSESAKGVVLVDKYNLVYTNKNVLIATQVDMKKYEAVFERVLS